MSHGKKQLEDILTISADEAILASAKTGLGVEDVLEAIVHRVPAPNQSRFRRRDTVDNRLQHIEDAKPRLCTRQDGLLRRNRQDIFELLLDRWDIGVREIYLIDDRDDREVLFHGEMHIRHRWASTPWAASTTRIAPSQAARLRDTSYAKST